MESIKSNCYKQLPDMVEEGHPRKRSTMGWEGLDQIEVQWSFSAIPWELASSFLCTPTYLPILPLPVLTFCLKFRLSFNKQSFNGDNFKNLSSLPSTFRSMRGTFFKKNVQLTLTY